MMKKEQKLFADYLGACPEHAQALDRMADSYCRQIVKMGLPRNSDCLDFIRNAVDVAVYAPEDAIAQRYIWLTELNCNGPHLTPRDKKEGQSAGADRRAENERLSLFFKATDKDSERESRAKALAHEALTRSKMESQGFNDQNRKILREFTDKNHLNDIAEIVSGAASITMMDREVVEELGRCFSQNAEPMTQQEKSTISYSLLVSTMTRIFCFELSDRVEKHFDELAGKRPVKQLTEKDIKKIKDDPELWGPAI